MMNGRDDEGTAVAYLKLFSWNLSGLLRITTKYCLLSGRSFTYFPRFDPRTSPCTSRDTLTCFVVVVLPNAVWAIAIRFEAKIYFSSTF
jgi:hypothetical protein